MSISFTIQYGDGVGLEIEDEGGKVSSVKWTGAGHEQIAVGSGISVGMEVSAVVPTLEDYGWAFSEGSSSSEQPKKKKKFFSKDEESSE